MVILVTKLWFSTEMTAETENWTERQQRWLKKEDLPNPETVLTESWWDDVQLQTYKLMKRSIFPALLHVNFGFIHLLSNSVWVSVHTGRWVTKPESFNVRQCTRWETGKHVKLLTSAWRLDIRSFKRSAR